MDTGMIALIGLGVAILGQVVSIVVVTRQQRDREIKAAEERGKMEQRMEEAEEDINRIGDKVRRTDDRIEKLSTSHAETATSLKHILAMLGDINGKLDRHMEAAH